MHDEEGNLANFVGVLGEVTERKRVQEALQYQLADPLKGGKTIIQAKRYRQAVPVAAVRELYGAMTNESAGKGILVTTLHYGRGAQDFVRG